MDTRLHTRAKRLFAVGLLGTSLLTPSIASAQSMPAGTPETAGTGTITGVVVCGSGTQPVDVAPESAEVMLQGSNISTSTAQGGRFILTGVPTSGAVTLNVVAANDGFEASALPGLTVGADQTLDVGSIELSVCPAPSLVMNTQPSDQDQPNDAADTGSN